MLFNICKDGVFKSIQGEGANTGKSAVFIRFAGCNMVPKCEFCDENYVDYSEWTDEQILHELDILKLFSMVVLIGGEPTLQTDLKALVDLLHQKEYFVAIEKNGLNPVPSNIDWITCSPKSDDIHSFNTKVDELKFVVNDEGLESLNRIDSMSIRLSVKMFFYNLKVIKRNSLLLVLI